MALSKKQIEYLCNYGGTKAVKELAGELGLTKGQVRKALDKLKRKGELRGKSPAAQEPALKKKTELTKHDYLWACCVGVIALVVYILTLAPEITGEDSGELITAAYTLGIPHPPGYPLWCILGKLFTILIPFGSIAYRVNFMSSFFAAGTVAFLFLVVQKITGSRPVAAGTALFFAFTHQFWSQSVIAEVYTLNAFFIVVCIFLLLIWEEKRSNRLVYLLSFVAGLGCTNHPTMAPLTPVFALYIIVKGGRAVLRPKVISISALLFLAALSVYLYLPLRARADPYMNWGNPRTIAGIAHHVMIKQYGGGHVFSKIDPERSWAKFGGQMAVYARAYVKQFTWFLFWLPVLGLWIHYRKDRTQFLAFLGVFLLTSVGFLVYTNFDLEKLWIFVLQAFFIPSYLIASVWMGMGLFWLWKVMLTKVNWKAVQVVAPVVVLLLPTINLLGNYYENDKSRYYYTYDLARAILDTMDEGAIFFPSGDHHWFPLMYFQGVLGLRPDVTIVRKFGVAEKKLYQGLLDQLGIKAKFGEEIPQWEIDKYIILNNRDKPIYYYYLVPHMSDLPDYVEVPEGLLCRVIHRTDLPNYKRKISEEYWKGYTFQNFADEIVAEDYAAKTIITDYHMARARCYFEEGEMDKGFQEVEKFQTAAERVKERLNNLGNMLVRRGLFKEAIIIYEKAISHDPYLLIAFLNMAGAYCYLKDYDNCLKYFNRAIEIDPGNLHAHLMVARTYTHKGEIDKATTKLEEVIQRFPSHYVAYRMLGFIYLEQKKDKTRAFELFRTSLMLNPEQPDLRELIGVEDKEEKQAPLGQ